VNPGLNAVGGIPSDDDIPDALSARKLPNEHGGDPEGLIPVHAIK